MRTELSSRFTRNRCGFTGHLAGLLLLTATTALPAAAQGQIQNNFGSRTTISGSVFVENMNQPAARVKVDVRAISGGQVAVAYTDSSGCFQATEPNGGSYIISVQEPGYEPIQQRVEQNGPASGVTLTLKKAKTPAVETEPTTERYTVSVHDLNVPGKARKAFDKGLERLQKQDPAGSIAHFEEATNVFPDYYEAFYQLGVANMELRRGDEAERALQKAIDLSGGHNAEPQFAMGALLCDRAAYGDAERVLRLGLENDSVSWRGYVFLGQALYGQNEFAEAEKSARMALSRKGDAAAAYILLANIDIRRHDYRKAITELDSYLRLKPDGPTSQQAREVRNAAERMIDRFSRIFNIPQFVY